MNCPQCQAANGPDAGFCGRCGAQLAVAEPATPPGYGAPSASGGYAPSGGYGAPSGPPSGYGQAPGGYSQAGPIPPAGPPQGAGYPQGQYQPPAGGWQAPGSGGSGGVPPVSFDLNRATRVDKIVAVATFITMISIWMPWFTISFLGTSVSGSGTAAHGWLWLEFLLGLALLVYLVARVAWETMPFSMPVAHDRILIVGTAVQLLFILIAFFDIPSGFGWSFGAFLGLLAALAAAGPVLVPAFRSFRESRKGTAGGSHSY